MSRFLTDKISNKISRDVSSAFRLTLPVLTGYVFLGVTFGLLVKSSGLDWWVPILMSLVIYSGALEFASVPLLFSAFSPVSAFFLSITLSARHLFYGIPMLKKYAKTGIFKPFLIFGLTDETFSVLSTTAVPEGVSPDRFYFFVTLFDYLYWNAGTALGVLLGGIDVNLKGLDFVLTALFVVLFLEQIGTKTGMRSGFLGLFISAVALLLFGSSRFVLVAMAVLIVALLFGRRVIEYDKH